MFRPNTKPARGGFTLIELLVVMSIIALMIAILLPALHKSRETQRMVQCRSNLRSLLLQNQMYIDDSRGEMPLCNPLPFWFYTYRIYGENVDLVNCPENEHLTPYTGANAYLPASAPFYTVNIGMNAWIANRSSTALFKLDSFTAPTQSMIFSDAYNTTATDTGTAYVQFSNWNIYSLIDRRHGSSANIGYLDGHVAIDPPDLAEFNSAVIQWNIFWLGQEL